MGEVEFPTRQALAEALHGTSPSDLVLDGYRSDCLPVGDVELRAAWRDVEDAVDAVETACDRLRALLPASRKAETIRELREARRG